MVKNAFRRRYVCYLIYIHIWHIGAKMTCMMHFYKWLYPSLHCIPSSCLPMRLMAIVCYITPTILFMRFCKTKCLFFFLQMILSVDFSHLSYPKHHFAGCLFCSQFQVFNNLLLWVNRYVCLSQIARFYC